MSGAPHHRVTSSSGAVVSPAGGGGTPTHLARWITPVTLGDSAVIGDGAGNLASLASIAFGAAPASSGEIRFETTFAIRYDDGGGFARAAISRLPGSLRIGEPSPNGEPNLDLFSQANWQINVVGGARLNGSSVLTQIRTSWRWMTGGGVTWDADTLAANKTLTATSEAQFQFLDMGGADRVVFVPTPSGGQTGLWYTLENTSDGDELLDCQQVDTTHVVDLRPGGQCTVLQDATETRAMFRGVACFGALSLDVAGAVIAPGTVTAFDAVDPAADVAGSLVAGSLTPARDAIYRLSFSLSGATAGLADVYVAAIHVGGVATAVRASLSSASGTDQQTAAASGLVFVGAGQAVTLVVTSAQNLTAQGALLTVEKVT